MTSNLNDAPYDGNPSELGDRLRASREFLQLTQADVGDALGVPRTAVHAMEAGTRRVTTDELKRLARLYRRPVSWLIGEDEPTPDDQVQALYRVAQGLTEADRVQVLEFARFLAGQPRSKEPRA